MESTFGLPRYIFPARNEITERITEFVDQAFSSDQVPIFLTYSLGKAQELMKILGDKGYKTCVHATVFNLTKIYEEYGVKFGNYKLYAKHPSDKAENLEEGVLIVPPWVRGSAMIKDIPKKRMTILTGWALDFGIKNFFGTDEVFPLSDHADFSELTEYVGLVEPQKVYTVHGFSEFPDFLKKEGFDAEQFKERTKIPKAFSKELL